MSAITRWMDRKLYPDYSDDWDYKRFRTYIEQYLSPEFTVLDLGAGRGARREVDFKGKVKCVAGVDPDPAVFQNPYLDEAKLLPLPSSIIPYPDNHFDLVFALNVLEHVREPARLLQEIRRVLRPGGIFVARTPNKRHYVALAARLTPHRFHEFYLEKVLGKPREDTFPTLYRCNTPEALRRHARESGLTLRDIQLWEGRPGYLRPFAAGYLFAYLYERLVNRFALLARFRMILVFSLEKPQPQP